MKLFFSVVDGLTPAKGSAFSLLVPLPSLTVCVYIRSPYLLRYMDAFVKQVPVSETIFGNIKKPPDIICVVVFLDCVNSTDCLEMSESVFFTGMNVNESTLKSFYCHCITFIKNQIKQFLTSIIAWYRQDCRF